jgi:hypothetical protein
MSHADFTERVNAFLYRQHIRRLTVDEIEAAQDWSLKLIRRENPEWNDEQVGAFYDNLIHVQIIAVDEWTRRMR